MRTLTRAAARSMTPVMTDSGGDRAEEGTARFARELKRLYLFGALRPEKWPDLVAELEDG
jgi:hypothetical protein